MAQLSKGLGSARRKAVGEVESLVQTGPIEGIDGVLPLMVTPAMTNVDLGEWAVANRDQIESNLDVHGAVVFRGFGLDDAQAFEAVAGAICPDLFAEYGDLPSEPSAEKVYFSTPYPEDKMILFHNESSHLPQWPMRQFFFCLIPAEEGGTTPLLDCRLAYERLDPTLRDEFEQKGLTYVRNFAEGLDVPWQEFFHTDDRSEVERTCADAGMTCEWTERGLRIKQHSPAVATHPRTGEKSFFNQIQLHHTSCLDDETRKSLRDLFSEEDMPRNVYFGDGTPISDTVMDEIGELYEELCVEFPWEAGDMIAVDNMLVAHARRPFSGQRKVLVAMGHMIDDPTSDGAAG
jgi:alpha-ketoglutarate-dependent taurine dioxygenase